jgi:zinc/manganese transport system substrate-binding protein
VIPARLHALRPRPAVAVAVLVLLSGAGCAAAPESAAPGTAGGPCPVEPVAVAVSVDQWGDTVARLGGGCARVTTVVRDSTSDPHDYEPTPADAVVLEGARLVVVNGLGYDAWATAAVEARSPRPSVVEAAAAGGAASGDNPHLWYRPAAVDATARAVTDALGRLEPGARAYFDERATEWRRDLARWTDLVAAVAGRHRGRSYAATEPVADPLAEALGLRAVTPAGYAAAAGNESDPAPGDVTDFLGLLDGHRADVLVVNNQTEGPVPERLRAAAEAAGVPVVEVTETLPPGQDSFVAWQLDQLGRLDEALGGSRG